MKLPLLTYLKPFQADKLPPQVVAIIESRLAPIVEAAEQKRDADLKARREKYDSEAQARKEKYEAETQARMDKFATDIERMLAEKLTPKYISEAFLEFMQEVASGQSPAQPAVPQTPPKPAPAPSHKASPGSAK